MWVCAKKSLCAFFRYFAHKILGHSDFDLWPQGLVIKANLSAASIWDSRHLQVRPTWDRSALDLWPPKSYRFISESQFRKHNASGPGCHRLTGRKSGCRFFWAAAMQLCGFKSFKAIMTKLQINSCLTQSVALLLLLLEDVGPVNCLVTKQISLTQSNGEVRRCKAQDWGTLRNSYLWNASSTRCTLIFFSGNGYDFTLLLSALA